MGFAPASSSAQSLRGSSRSLTVQNVQARAHDFTYLQTPDHVRRFVELGYLVPLRGSRDYDIDEEVSFAYGRPQVRTFVERLAGQYRRGCGEVLVVTSVTRPLNRQPRNASDRSVHPTGMAVDLRRSNIGACRRWLEDVLVSLEANGVLEATRESRPPHYHIALFPAPYARYVDGLMARTTQASETRVAAAMASEAAPKASEAPVTSTSGNGQYRVRSGDALWDIASAHRITVTALRQSNNLSGSRIYPGQILTIPSRGAAARSAVGGNYRVRSGDALWDIARANGTTIAAIQQSNNLSGSRIYPGQILTIPSRGAAARSAVGGNYRVRSGDALWDIARANGTTIAAIQQSNGLRGSRIYPGQILTIPSGRAPGGQRAVSTSYRVQRGDSLWDIARAHSTTVTALRQSNNLRGSRIYPGQVLTIPMQER
jgi:LysM repeat protein